MNHILAFNQLAELLNELATNGRLRPKSQNTLKRLLNSHKELVESFVTYLENEVRAQINERVEEILKEKQDTSDPPAVPNHTQTKTVKKAVVKKESPS